ncbi:MATE family efflux transporter [Bacteroides ovatus]|nr:MATE family efflux transporter [Bacteroides ovatus]UVP77028.1 MATE family efflux transporter [Bacteroides ovatus]
MYTNKQIWSVSYPILLSLLAQNVINVTDTAFLGHVSEVALGASAMGGLFYICVFTIAFGFSTGSQIVIARRNGEGRYSDVGPVMIQGIMFLFVMALLLFGFTKAFGGNIMRLLVSSRIHLRRNDGISGLAYLRILFLFYQCHVPGIVHRHYTH